MHYEIILESRDNSYIVDKWEDKKEIVRGRTPQVSNLESWRDRTKIPAENIPDTASVGDVVRYESKERAIATSDTATAIRNAHHDFTEAIHEYAEEFDATIRGLNTGLSDGDVLFLVDPENNLTPITGEEKAFSFPSGIIEEGGMVEARYPRLVGCPSDSLESGLAFDPFRVNERLMGLRYDAEHSKEISESPGVCQFVEGFSAVSTRFDSIESEDDLIPPFYVSIGGFDDGQFYSTLYDSGDERNKAKKNFNNYRPLTAVSGKPVWTIRDRWKQGDLVPVESVYFDDESKPAPLYVEIDPDADPISAKRTNQR